MFHGKIQIHPLPTVSIVGKGLVAEKELQDGLPTTSLGGHTLRKGFDFPPYKVGEPSQIAVEVEGLPLEVNDNPDN